MKYLIRFALRTIPRHRLHRISHIFLIMISPFYRGSKYEDPITGIGYRKMLSYGRINPRPNALAPNSLSLERHRLFWLYLKNKTNFFTDDLRLLHMAPEYCFLKRFRAMKNIDYVTADLNSPWADVHMDAHDIPFEENSFDVIFANHLLEHVQDDIKVMSEFYRVMKPGGWGIFAVPQDLSMEKTAEDPNVTDPKERERLYWQEDHLRLYGRDYADRLASVGFKVTEDDYIKTLGPELVEKYCLTPDEIVYYCQKPLDA